MYKINDVVVYGCSKVCSIKEIGILDFMKKPDKYYWLQPIGDKTTMLYVKIENNDKMREILSKGQADELIQNIPDMEEMYDRSNKIRDREYSQVLKSRDCLTWLKMWKGIKMEKLRKTADGKSLNASDEGNLKRVEDCISSEFSAVYHITKDEAVKKMHHSFHPEQAAI